MLVRQIPFFLGHFSLLVSVRPATETDFSLKASNWRHSVGPIWPVTLLTHAASLQPCDDLDHSHS